MPLLDRRLLILKQNILDRPLELLRQLRRPRDLAAGIPSRLRFLQNLANLVTGMMKRASNLSNAHAVPVSPANPCVVFHPEHPWLHFAVSVDRNSLWSPQYGWVPFTCRFLMGGWVPFRCRFPSATRYESIPFLNMSARHTERLHSVGRDSTCRAKRAIPAFPAPLQCIVRSRVPVEVARVSFTTQ